jgi:hypothetical protein
MLLARETHNSMLNLLQVSSNILECSQCTRHVCGEHVLEPLDALARGCFSASQAVFGLHVSHPSHISESNCSQAVAMVIVTAH